MQQVTIREIGLRENNRLYIKPVLPLSADPLFADYAFIYRDDTDVYWDSVHQRLFVIPMFEATPLEDCRQIVAAVKREYGDQLVVTPETRFKGISPELALELRKLLESAM